MKSDGICLTLSDLFYLALYPLGPSMLLQVGIPRFFSWLSNTPLYIYPSFILLHLADQFSQHHLLKKTVFSPLYILASVVVD